jgi:hypothetical protein
MRRSIQYPKIHVCDVGVSKLHQIRCLADRQAETPSTNSLAHDHDDGASHQQRNSCPYHAGGGSRFADLGLEIFPREGQTPRRSAHCRRPMPPNGGRLSRSSGSRQSEVAGSDSSRSRSTGLHVMAGRACRQPAPLAVQLTLTLSAIRIVTGSLPVSAAISPHPYPLAPLGRLGRRRKIRQSRVAIRSTKK